jgi:hypothetical protein
MATKQHKQIMNTLNFSNQDISFNRQGAMSPRQQRRFMRSGRGRVLLAAVCGGLSAGFIAQATRDTSVLTFYTVQVINAVAVGWLVWATNMRFFKDAMVGRVEQATGRPTVEVYRKGKMLYIGDKPIQASQQLIDAMDPNYTYCAYIAPNSGRLLALEPKPKARPRQTSRTQPNKRTTSTTPRLGSRRR